MSSELLRSAPTVLWHRVSSTPIATNERKSLCLCHRHSPVADYSSCKSTTHHDNRSNSNSQCHIYCPLSFPYLLLLRIHCFFFQQNSITWMHRIETTRNIVVRYSISVRLPCCTVRYILMRSCFIRSRCETKKEKLMLLFSCEWVE